MSGDGFFVPVLTPVGTVEFWHEVEVNDHPIDAESYDIFATYEDVPFSAFHMLTQESLLFVDVDPPERDDMYDDEVAS